MTELERLREKIERLRELANEWQDYQERYSYAAGDGYVAGYEDARHSDGYTLQEILDD